MDYLLDFLSHYWLLLLVIFIIVLLDYTYKRMLKAGKMPTAFDMSNLANQNMLKFLATTYLTNNAFLDDEKVIKLLTKFNYTKEQVIKFAEEHKDELLNNSEETKSEKENDKDVSLVDDTTNSDSENK